MPTTTKLFQFVNVNEHSLVFKAKIDLHNAYKFVDRWKHFLPKQKLMIYANGSHMQKLHSLLKLVTTKFYRDLNSCLSQFLNSITKLTICNLEDLNVTFNG